MTLDDLIDVTVGDDQIQTDISLPRKRQQPKEESYEMTPYNPFAMRSAGGGGWDAMCMERMLTIKRPDSIPGTIWITEAGFAETLSLLPLNKVEQHNFWKKFRRIQMLSTGELNKHIIDSRQERLMMELVSQKSRLDVIEGGNVNERGQWNTTNTYVEQTLRQPAPQRPKGFIASVADGLTGRQ